MQSLADAAACRFEQESTAAFFINQDKNIKNVFFFFKKKKGKIAFRYAGILAKNVDQAK